MCERPPGVSEKPPQLDPQQIIETFQHVLSVFWFPSKRPLQKKIKINNFNVSQKKFKKFIKY